VTINNTVTGNIGCCYCGKNWSVVTRVYFWFRQLLQCYTHTVIHLCHSVFFSRKTNYLF